jgi:hypothetical protein
VVPNPVAAETTAPTRPHSPVYRLRYSLIAASKAASNNRDAACSLIYAGYDECGEGSHHDRREINRDLVPFQRGTDRSNTLMALPEWAEANVPTTRTR